MRRVRIGWVVLNVIAATALLGTFTLLVAPVDRHKRIVGIWAKLWARWILLSAGMKVEVRGREHMTDLDQVLYMGNHTSALDIPLALAYLPGPVVFMAKKELFRVPFFGWALRAMGSIPVDRSNSKRARESVDRAVNELAHRRMSLLLYPEGTRTADGELLPFKRGGFILAIRSGLPIVPVVLHGSFAALRPKTFDLKKGKIILTIGEPIKTVDRSVDDRQQLLEDTFARMDALLHAN